MPSSAQDELCNPRLKEDSPLLGIQDFVVLPTNDYGALIRALARHGPIAISVDASWGHYEEGVFGAGAKKARATPCERQPRRRRRRRSAAPSNTSSALLPTKTPCPRELSQG